jgi:hypothetical protein
MSGLDLYMKVERAMVCVLWNIEIEWNVISD